MTEEKDHITCPRCGKLMGFCINLPNSPDYFFKKLYECECSKWELTLMEVCRKTKRKQMIDEKDHITCPQCGKLMDFCINLSNSPDYFFKELLECECNQWELTLERRGTNLIRNN